MSIENMTDCPDRDFLLRERDAGRLVECLDQGFVRYEDHMGQDSDIIRAARVSYGKGTKATSTDRGLMRYLMRHYHSTPFEMCEVKFHVFVPMDCWRQWIRHRTASVNEYSTRYSEAIDAMQTTDKWRLQATANRQGSSGLLEEWPEGWTSTRDGVSNADGFAIQQIGIGPLTPGEFLTMRERNYQQAARALYKERLALGVAREQARKDLPLSTYTTAYWKVDLHNLFNFLRLRMDSHAQAEIREFANALFKLTEPLFPLACEAFQDYVLNGMRLSRMDIDVLRRLLAGEKDHVALCESVGMSKKGELPEFEAKAAKLGLTLPASMAVNSTTT